MSLEFTTSGEIFPKFTISTPEGSVDAKLLHSDQSVDTYSFTALKSGAYTLKFSSPAPQREGAYRFSAYSSCDLRKGPYYGNLDRDLDEPSLKSTTSTQYFYAKDIEYCQGNGQLKFPSYYRKPSILNPINGYTYNHQLTLLHLKMRLEIHLHKP